MSPFLRHALAQAALPADAERCLARAAAQGDGEARDELICSGLRNVVLHGLRLGHRGEALEEAVAAGIEGLILAVDRFDPDRGVRLSTYAWNWIARAMCPPRIERVVGGLESRRGWDTEVLADLPEPWAAVLGLRFGLLCEDGVALTTAEVSERLGLTVWQVRDREAKALSHLRTRLARVSRRASLAEADPP